MKMTREEAISHIKDVICENNTIKPNIVVFEQEKEALYIAIKALEQEPIIDRIRDEANAECISDGLGRYIRFDVLDRIINKYKTESEE